MFSGVIYLYKACKKIETGNETHLLRGICSNGPDVGIVPHKSLLETSTTLRLDIPASSLGMGPVK